MSKSEIKDQVVRSSVVMQKFPYLDIPSLIPPACCNSRLYANFMTEGTEERLELHGGPIVRLCTSSHRLTAMDMIGVGVLDDASCTHRACGGGG